MTNAPRTFGDTVSLTVSGRIATVILDRGDGRNAMSMAAIRDLTDAAHWLHTQTDISVIILTGQGAFSAGADLKDPEQATIAKQSLLEQRQAFRLGPDLCAAWQGLEQITIAAIETYCIGGGVALGVVCDHRIMAEDAFLQLPEVPLGMNMSWQSNPRLVALLGPSRAKLFTILGQPCHAPTALTWGLVDEISPQGQALDAAQALAAQYAKLPPLSVRMTKQAINAAAMPLGYTASFMDRDQFLLAATSEDQKAAIRAFRDKRNLKDD